MKKFTTILLLIVFMLMATPVYADVDTSKIYDSPTNILMEYKDNYKTENGVDVLVVGGIIGMGAECTIEFYYTPENGSFESYDSYVYVYDLMADCLTIVDQNGNVVWSDLDL